MVLKNKANPDLWQRFLRVYDATKHQFHWVKGHASNVENNRCDELAVAASKKPNLPVDEGYEAIKKGAAIGLKRFPDLCTQRLLSR